MAASDPETFPRAEASQLAPTPSDALTSLNQHPFVTVEGQPYTTVHLMVGVDVEFDCIAFHFSPALLLASGIFLNGGDLRNGVTRQNVSNIRDSSVEDMPATFHVEMEKEWTLCFKGAITFAFASVTSVLCCSEGQLRSGGPSPSESPSSLTVSMQLNICCAKPSSPSVGTASSRQLASQALSHAFSTSLIGCAVSLDKVFASSQLPVLPGRVGDVGPDLCADPMSTPSSQVWGLGIGV